MPRTGSLLSDGSRYYIHRLSTFLNVSYLTVFSLEQRSLARSRRQTGTRPGCAERMLQPTPNELRLMEQISGYSHGSTRSLRCTYRVGPRGSPKEAPNAKWPTKLAISASSSKIEASSSVMVKAVKRTNRVRPLESSEA